STTAMASPPVRGGQKCGVYNEKNLVDVRGGWRSSMRRRDRVLCYERVWQATSVSDKRHAAPRTWRIWPSRQPDAGDLRRRGARTSSGEAFAHGGCPRRIARAAGSTGRPQRAVGGLSWMAVGGRPPMEVGWLPAMAVARLRSYSRASRTRDKGAHTRPSSSNRSRDLAPCRRGPTSFCSGSI